MHDLAALQQMLEEALLKLEIRTEPARLYDPVRYMISLGGKRMRPMLVLLGCSLFDQRSSEALPAACAIELFHNFTLLHDDIMDQAPLRRNQPTVHTKWNINTAILSGDAMLVKAYQLMMQTDLKARNDVMEIFSETALQVCEGQQLDLDFEDRHQLSLADYMNMIQLKTAVLLGASLQIGALIGGASREDSSKLYQFGKNIGVAFQLQDDMLDVYGNPEKFGKQLGGDILSNKKTWLFLKALERSSETDRNKLVQLYASNGTDPQSKISSVISLFDKAGIRELIKTEIQKHYSIAVHLLESIHAMEGSKEELRRYCDKLMVREN